MISLKHQFLFIHIPKTAGNSIQNVLKSYSEERIVSVAPHQDGVERFEIRSDSYKIHKHSTLSEYQDQLGKDVIDGLFKFACVRNPWERMISFYFSPHRGTVSWDRAKFVELVANVEPVTHFVSSGSNADHGKSCFEHIDCYIRFDELNQGFGNVCARIGLPMVQLPQRNASIHTHYKTYYDNALIELVRERFFEEIGFFEFKF